MSLAFIRQGSIDHIHGSDFVLLVLRLSEHLYKTSFLGPHRLAWPRTPAFHAGDRGSNPLGDAISFLSNHKNRFYGALVPAGIAGHASPWMLGVQSEQSFLAKHG
jgi:hypothetical protein